MNKQYYKLKLMSILVHFSCMLILFCQVDGHCAYVKMTKGCWKDTRRKVER